MDRDPKNNAGVTSLWGMNMQQGELIIPMIRYSDSLLFAVQNISKVPYLVRIFESLKGGKKKYVEAKQDELELELASRSSQCGHL